MRKPDTLSPPQKQRQAQLWSYGPVWIRRSGDFIVVELEAPDGSWVEVIREQSDGNYSHIVEPLGIEACFEKHLNPAKS